MVPADEKGTEQLVHEMNYLPESNTPLVNPFNHCSFVMHLSKKKYF
jgi:hypothetical protein